MAKIFFYYCFCFVFVSSCYANTNSCEYTAAGCQFMCTIIASKDGKLVVKDNVSVQKEEDAVSVFIARYAYTKDPGITVSNEGCYDRRKNSSGGDDWQNQKKLQREREAASREAMCIPQKGFIKELPTGCDIPKSRWADCCRGGLCEEHILQECSQQTKLKSNPVGFTQDYVGKINDGYGYFVEYRVTNNLNQKIKDFLLSCNQISKSGTVLISNKETIYDLVEPGQTKKFKQEFIGVHKQTNSVDCELKSYKK
jgi:hypothetical protein